MVNNEQKRALWYFYVPISLGIAYTAFYIQMNVSPFLNLDYAIFLSLGILVGFFPIKTEDSILFLLNGISLPVLVIFGLVPEMIISSIALIVLLVRSNIKMDQHFKYPLNLLMFHFLSVFSAVIYYSTILLLERIFNVALGILSLAVYMIAHLILNHIAIYLIQRYFYKKSNVKLFDENFTFLFYINIFVVPLSFILIYLYEITGSMGIIIGALPFVTLTVGTNFYFKSKINNNYLRKMNMFSQELNAKKTRENIVKTFSHAFIEIFPADTLSYFSVEDENTIIRKKIITERINVSDRNDVFKLSDKSILKRAIINDQIFFHANACDWKTNCLNDLDYEAESAIVIPVKLLERTQGVILMTHKTRSMYDEMLVSLIEVFHKYFTIALDNAYHYEQLEESVEKDYLTNLPNLKGFSKYLQMLKDETTLNHLSLIVLDLDHFKKVNDTHGHPAGNEILKRLAKRLRKYLNEDIYIARYGGEEFIILLPDYTENDAFIIAEDLRQRIESQPFKISNSMQTGQEEKISITASLGLATSIDNCDEIEELINLADRAMYIGSKQKGRNKVTVAKRGS